MANLGDAYINVHADTSKLTPEIEAGAKKAAEEAEANDDFGGLVKAADKAGSRAGDKFGQTFIRDANGRLRNEKGEFVKEFEKIGAEAGDKAGNALGDNLEKKTKAKVGGLGKLLAPAWTRTIAAWIAAIAPGAVQLVGTLAPAVGILAAIVPMAIGGAAALGILKIAFTGLSKIVKDAATNTTLFNQEMAKLGPSTQQFVKTLVALKPVFADFKKSIQDSFFAGLNPSASFGKIKSILDNLKFSADALAKTLGQQLGAAFSTLTNGKNLGNLNSILAAFNDTLTHLGPSLGNILGGLLRLGTVAAPLLEHLATSFEKLTGHFADFISKAAANGKLSDFFDKAGAAFSQLISLGSDLLDIVFSIFSAGSKAGGGGAILSFIHLLAQSIEELNKNGTLEQFFKAFNEVSSSLFKIITPLLPVVAKLASVLGGAFLKIIEALTPPLILIAQSIADALIPVLPALGKALDSLAPILASLGGVLADLFKQITPDLANLLVDLFVALANTFIDLEPSIRIILPALEKLTVVLVKLLTDETISALQAFVVVLPALAGAFLVTVAPLIAFSKLMDGIIYVFDHFITPFLQTFPAAADQAGSKLAGIAGKIGDWFASVGTAIADFFTKTVPKYWDKFINWLESLPAKLAALAKKIIKAAGDAFLIEIGVVIGLIVAAFTKLPGKIVDGLSSLGSKVGSFLSAEWHKGLIATDAFIDEFIRRVKKIPGQVVDALAGFGRTVAKVFSNAWDTAVNKVSTAIANIVGFVRGLPGKIVALGGKLLEAGGTIITKFLNGLAHPGKIVNSISDTIFGFLKDKLNYVIGKINDGINSVGKFVGGLPNIPKLARGAFVTHPTLALLGEKNPEVVLPTDDPIRARQLLDESGLSRTLDFHSSSPTVLVTVKIGEQELTDIVDTRVAVSNNRTSRQLTYGARTA